MKKLILLVLLTAGCSTTKVITSDDFYYGCINGVYVDRMLSGQYDQNNLRMKETSLMCLMTEQKYKERIKQEVDGPKDKETRGRL